MKNWKVKKMKQISYDLWDIAPQLKANYTKEPFTPMDKLRFIELLMDNNYSVGNALLQFDKELEAKYKGEQ